MVEWGVCVIAVAVGAGAVGAEGKGLDHSAARVLVDSVDTLQVCLEGMMALDRRACLSQLRRLREDH